MDFLKERLKMRRSRELKILLEPISALEKVMKQSKCKWMIIGGVAASLLGKPRFTADIDAIATIEDEEILGILKSASKRGFMPRIKKPIEFAKRNRVLLLKHIKSNVNLDLSLGTLPFEKAAIEKSRLQRIDGVSFYLPTSEDLVIFKAIAHRPQDIMDIQEIINNNPEINRVYIKKKVKEFARFLEMPEVWEDIKNIVISKKKNSLYR